MGCAVDIGADEVWLPCRVAPGAGDDCNGNCVADACEIAEGMAADCDGNGTLDRCDFEAGAADCNDDGTLDVCQMVGRDCNHNGLLDSCESFDGEPTDCNENGSPDDCEIGAAIALDCNANGTLDVCDLADGTSLDVDGNCIPDECHQSPAPRAENPIVPKSRFVSFAPVNAGCSTAIRVRFVSLTPNGVGGKFADFEGDWRWVGPPEPAWEDSSRTQPLQAAPLQCDPHFRQWERSGLVHVYGAGIMPESAYQVQHFSASCGDMDDPACYSDSLMVTTDLWGDCAAPFVGDPDAGRQPDFRDIAGLVAKFSAHGGPPRVATELEPNVMDLSIEVDFKDISACVASFLNQAYPLDGPTACP